MLLTEVTDVWCKNDMEQQNALYVQKAELHNVTRKVSIVTTRLWWLNTNGFCIWLKDVVEIVARKFGVIFHN